MLLNVIQGSLSGIVRWCMLSLNKRNFRVMRINVLRLHVLLLNLVECLLKKISTFLSKRAEWILRSKLCLLLLISCLLWTKLYSFRLHDFPVRTSFLTDQTFIFVLIIVNIFACPQSFTSTSCSSEPLYRYLAPGPANLVLLPRWCCTRLLLQWRYLLLIVTLIHILIFIHLVILFVVVEGVTARGTILLVVAELGHVRIYLEV